MQYTSDDQYFGSNREQSGRVTVLGGENIELHAVWSEFPAGKGLNARTRLYLLVATRVFIVLYIFPALDSISLDIRYLQNPVQTLNISNCEKVRDHRRFLEYDTRLSARQACSAALE